MKYTGNYNLKKPEGTDVVNIDDLNENADIIDQKLKELEDGVYDAPPDSVNDLAIGTRTPDQTQVPTSPGSGTLLQILSWLANRIKAITGKTNWWDAPPTTLQAAKNHIDAAAPHSGHETPAGAQTKANAAAGAVLAELNAHVAENASQHGDLTTLKTSQKSSLVEAINELFTNVSDGKLLVGGAIADVDPNVVIPTDPTFQQLANAIGEISTGKKWARAEVRVPSDTQEQIVTGLDFKPRNIFMATYKPPSGTPSEEYYLAIGNPHSDTNYSAMAFKNIIVTEVMPNGFKYKFTATSSLYWLYWYVTE